MKPSFKKFLRIINIVPLVACVMLLARCSTMLFLDGISDDWSVKTGPTSRSVDPVNGPSLARSTGAIVQRNLFCSSCETSPELEVSGPQPGDDSPLAIPGELVLIATLICEENPRWSFAVIQDSATGRAMLFSTGSAVRQELVVSAIEGRRVTLTRGGRSGHLDLDAAAGAAAATPRKPGTGSGARGELAAGIRQVRAGRFEIRRETFERVLSNTSQVARGGRIIPMIRRGGKPGGFKVHAIRPGSLYALIGLKNGDILHAVNGHAIDSPDKVLPIYNQLRGMRHLTLSFTRAGKTITHDYSIR